jgi:tyrosine-protein phosphatase SIW14
MKLRSALLLVVGAFAGVAFTYVVLSYRHSTGPFVGDVSQLERRPPAWAQPLAVPPLKNFYKVSSDLYRGAQPTHEGFVALARLGVRTDVNLRLGGSDAELLDGTRIAQVEIPAEPWELDDEDVVAFLEIVGDRGRAPVFVHCSHGADRTGAMTAIYRTAIQGWSMDEAIAEMTEGGFGYHAIWENLPAYLRALDVLAMKEEAGLE